MKRVRRSARLYKKNIVQDVPKPSLNEALIPEMLHEIVSHLPLHPHMALSLTSRTFYSLTAVPVTKANLFSIYLAHAEARPADLTKGEARPDIRSFARYALALIERNEPFGGFGQDRNHLLVLAAHYHYFMPPRMGKIQHAVVAVHDDVTLEIISEELHDLRVRFQVDCLIGSYNRSLIWRYNIPQLVIQHYRPEHLVINIRNNRGYVEALTKGLKHQAHDALKWLMEWRAQEAMFISSYNHGVWGDYFFNHVADFWKRSHEAILKEYFPILANDESIASLIPDENFYVRLQDAMLTDVVKTGNLELARWRRETFLPSSLMHLLSSWVKELYFNVQIPESLRKGVCDHHDILRLFPGLETQSLPLHCDPPDAYLFVRHDNMLSTLDEWFHPNWNSERDGSSLLFVMHDQLLMDSHYYDEADTAKGVRTITWLLEHGARPSPTLLNRDRHRLEHPIIGPLYWLYWRYAETGAANTNELRLLHQFHQQPLELQQHMLALIEANL